MKTEIEKLVDEIYRRQTYGFNADNHIEKLNRLTGVNKPTKAVKNNFVKPVVSGRSELLFAFRDYWKKSKHQNIDEAIKGFLRTKKGKQ